jgi:predicted thioesterase
LKIEDGAIRDQELQPLAAAWAAISEERAIEFSRSMQAPSGSFISYPGGSVRPPSRDSLAQLLEEASLSAIQEFIPPGQLSLGTEVRIKHLSPTPLGRKVVAHAILKEVNKNLLIFLVDAYDEKEKVAEGERIVEILPCLLLSSELDEDDKDIFEAINPAPADSF